MQGDLLQGDSAFIECLFHGVRVHEEIEPKCKVLRCVGAIPELCVYLIRFPVFLVSAAVIVGMRYAWHVSGRMLSSRELLAVMFWSAGEHS